jgi:hypothetical protein
MPTTSSDRRLLPLKAGIAGLPPPFRASVVGAAGGRTRGRRRHDISTPGDRRDNERLRAVVIDETLAKLLEIKPVYAASRINQLRKSSSAASQVSHLQ